MTIREIGAALCLAAGIACGVLHIATFLTVVPGLLILVPLILMAGAILCARATQGWNFSDYRCAQPSVPTGKTAMFGYALLVYAAILFVHFYRNSGGASSVGIVDGRFFYMYKGAMIRPISQEEYKMFPTQVVRIMSAWIGMMSTFCLSTLLVQVEDLRSQRTPKQVL
jgi:hypothetical protein